MWGGKVARDPLVTAAGIARLAGVGRAAVSNWRRRHPHFPRPVGGSGASPSFSLAEVEKWLREQGKLVELPLVERVWHRLEADPRGVAEALLAAGEALRDHADYGPAAVSEAAGCPGLGELGAEGPAAAFELLAGRHLDANTREHTRTPEPVAALMAALAGEPRSVLDPACGAGGLLAAAAADGRVPALHGTDSDAVLARLADLRLALRRPEGAAIRSADALRTDPGTERPVEAVLCHPPFNQRHWGHRDLVHDPRWEYGVPARTDSELAWVQHALARLRPGGTAVLLMPPAAASRRTGRRIRAALLRRGALRAVVALPAGSAPPHHLPLHLWVLRRPAAEPPADPRLLLVDAASQEEWSGVTEQTLAAWRAFNSRGTAAEQPEVWRVLPVLQLLDDDVDLVPARHLARGPGGDSASLAAVRGEFDAAARNALRLAPAPGARDAGSPPPAATVGELLRTGALAMLSADAEPEAGDVAVPLHPSDGGAPAYVVDGARAEAEDATEPGAWAVLRVDPQVLDAWFVAGCLGSSANTRLASGHGARTRLDVRRLRVPRMSLAEQQRLGHELRRLAEFRRALHRAGALGLRYAQGVCDGLVDGSLQPRREPQAEPPAEGRE